VAGEKDVHRKLASSECPYPFIGSFQEEQHDRKIHGGGV